MLNTQSLFGKQPTKLKLINIDFDHFVEQNINYLIDFLNKNKVNAFDEDLAINAQGKLVIINEHKVGSYDITNCYAIKTRTYAIKRNNLSDYAFAKCILNTYSNWLFKIYKRNLSLIKQKTPNLEWTQDADILFTHQNYIDYCFDNLPVFEDTDFANLSAHYVLSDEEYFLNKALISLRSYSKITYQMFTWIANSTMLIEHQQSAIYNILFKRLLTIYQQKFSKLILTNFKYNKFLLQCNSHQVAAITLPINIIKTHATTIERDLEHTKVVFNLQTDEDVDHWLEELMSTIDGNNDNLLIAFLLNRFVIHLSNQARRRLQLVKCEAFTICKIRDYILNNA